jgi:hypothetical protein
MPTSTVHFRNLLHAANLRHGTHSFTSLRKEGVMRIFPPLQTRRLRLGLNPRTWVPEASTLTPRPPKPLVIDVTVSSNIVCSLNTLLVWPLVVSHLKSCLKHMLRNKTVCEWYWTDNNTQSRHCRNMSHRILKTLPLPIVGKCHQHIHWSPMFHVLIVTSNARRFCKLN